MVGGGSALRPDLRDEYEMPDARCCRGGGKLRRRQPVDAVIKLGCNAAADMSNAGKMDDLIDAVEKRTPVDRLRQIRVLHDFDSGG